MKVFSKFLMLSLAMLAFSCKSNPRSGDEVQNIGENTEHSVQETQVVQDQSSQELTESSVTQNEVQ